MAMVEIVIGSKSDTEMIKPALDMLRQLSIEYKVSIISAHRHPEKLRKYGIEVANRGVEVIIAAAGGAAHLPGVLASWTTIPVIGVPLPVGDMNGIDALLSITQMPAGVPVACTGIGESGVKNAALLAAQILGLKHEQIKTSYIQYRENLSGD
ncbi:MAG: 5-(carboxyamino)imidazole ribonucleotide mutase [Chloroflexota bacterium]|nr:5-(carboxyamino)imidazole ribonucleotide mutase [Chloroflexota bacterium]